MPPYQVTADDDERGHFYAIGLPDEILMDPGAIGQQGPYTRYMTRDDDGQHVRLSFDNGLAVYRYRRPAHRGEVPLRLQQEVPGADWLWWDLEEWLPSV